MDIKWTPTKPQAEVWGLLNDLITLEILFGGGAGGGKSFIGCLWLVCNCLRYAGTRWFIGRVDIGVLKQTTLKTLDEVLDMFGLEEGKDYWHNENKKQYTFLNGSEIVYMDIRYYPGKDPKMNALGGLEITGAFIDEANQAVELLRQTIGSRCRYKLDEYGLVPKVLFTCNPAKNWVYREFYKPAKEGVISKDKAFVQALAVDNINVSKHYIKKLSKLKGAARERLYKGNWEYDDDPTIMFEHEQLLNVFNVSDVDNDDQYYISCDVARLGSDKTVICLWKGLTCIDIREFSKQITTDTAQEVLNLADEYDVPLRNIIIDEDGVGGGVVDMVRCHGFVNNSAPKKVTRHRNYANLKTQCYFELARYVQSGELKINVAKYQDVITEELGLVKQRDVDKDTKLRISKKEEIKEELGRSPDFADAIMMRMWFELGKKERSTDTEVQDYYIDVRPVIEKEKRRSKLGIVRPKKSAVDSFINR